MRCSCYSTAVAGVVAAAPLTLSPRKILKRLSELISPSIDEVEGGPVADV